MARGARAKNRDVSERRCIVTGETLPKPALIRFVIGPDEAVFPDVLGKLPGRGMYIVARRDAIEAVKPAQFARAAKGKVTIPGGLADEIERQLARHVIDLISLARKAGSAVCGFEKVKGWLAGGERVRALLQASDGSERGKSKLWTPEGARFFGCLTSAELGLAFGRQSVIHGVLASGGLGDRVVEEAARLKGLRENDGGERAAGKD